MLKYKILLKYKLWQDDLLIDDTGYWYRSVAEAEMIAASVVEYGYPDTQSGFRIQVVDKKGKVFYEGYYHRYNIPNERDITFWEYRQQPLK